MAIHLSEYSDTWIQDFMTVATKLVDALDGHGGQGIEHIGSTAVPGLVSRPIIDIAVIAAPLALDEAASALAGLGYVKDSGLGEGKDDGSTSGAASGTVGSNAADDFSLVDRALGGSGFVRFRTPNDSVLHSLTLFDEESPLLHAHLAVRHTLMNNEALMQEFAGYKRGLAYTGAISVDEYRAAKAPMFQKLLGEAGMNEETSAVLAEHYR